MYKCEIPESNDNALYFLLTIVIALWGLVALSPQCNSLIAEIFLFFFVALETVFILNPLHEGLAYVDAKKVIWTLSIVSLINAVSILGAYNQVILNFFEGHTTTPVHSVPAKTAAVQPKPVQATPVQPKPATEVRLPNGETYILQNGKAYLIKSN